jgi:phosphatidylserine decarboxylase
MIYTNIKVLIHHLTPKFMLTKLAGILASHQLGSLTTFMIKKFAAHYKINMSEAKKETPEEYKTFNEFFTRELKDNARPIYENENSVTMPVDGTLAEFGTISYGRLIAAKGQDYSLRDLLGGNTETAKLFENGKFACIYLSPMNYHRIHMPFTGKLRQMIFIPGKFYSVNPLYVSKIDNLFTRNERVVCIFDTKFGPMAMVLVGATIVGSIATKWAGRVYPQNRKDITVYNYKEHEQISIDKGAEMGQFYLGSTVITIFPKSTVEFVNKLKTNDTVWLGNELANLTIN